MPPDGASSHRSSDLRSDPLWEAMLAPYHLATLLVADEIGLLDRLHRQPATTADVAQHYGMAVHAAETMLAVLTSKGHLAQHSLRFHVTDSSRQCLLRDGPYYCGPALELRRHRAIDHSVIRDVLFRARTGTSPVLFDTDMWSGATEHVARHRASTASMHALFFPAAMAVACHEQLHGVERMLDVAGGSGCFSPEHAERANRLVSDYLRRSLDIDPPRRESA